MQSRWPGWLVLLAVWLPYLAAPPAIEARTEVAEAPAIVAAAAEHGIVTRPIEESLRYVSVHLARGLLRQLRWLHRVAARSWRWLMRMTVLLAVAVAASMADRSLWTQWRTRGWMGVLLYAQLAAAVFALAVFDRRADRFGHLALAGAFIYSVLPWDFIPDVLAAGVFDDMVVVAAASRWFTSRCPAPVMEQHAARVAAWHARRREIERRRARLSR